MASPRVGWAVMSPPNGKAHYFSDQWSACGKWWYAGKLQALDKFRGGPCRACEKAMP